MIWEIDKELGAFLYCNPIEKTVTGFLYFHTETGIQLMDTKGKRFMTSESEDTALRFLPKILESYLDLICQEKLVIYADALEDVIYNNYEYWGQVTSWMREGHDVTAFMEKECKWITN